MRLRNQLRNSQYAFIHFSDPLELTRQIFDWEESLRAVAIA